MLPGLLLHPDFNSPKRIIAGATKTGVNAGVLAPYDT
jgi:hypothetical protein